MSVQRAKTQSLCFKLYLLKKGEEECVEGQCMVDQDYACRLWKNAIHYHTPGQESL